MSFRTNSGITLKTNVSEHVEQRVEYGGEVVDDGNAIPYIRTVDANTGDEIERFFLINDGYLYYDGTKLVSTKPLEVQGGIYGEWLYINNGEVTIASTGTVTLTGGNGIRLRNTSALSIADTNGTYQGIATINASDDTYFGYGSYNNNLGTVYYRGNNVRLQGKVNTFLNSGTGMLYLDGRSVIKAGNTVTFIWNGCGFVSSGKASAYFTIPLLRPLAGGVTATINKSTSTICIRQWNTYIYADGTNELSMSNFNTVTAGITDTGINVTATRTGGLGGNGTTTTANMTNNAPITISCHMVVTFS